MVRLITKFFVRPYKWWILAVIVLQLAQVIASLYLPNLNGRIIDEGVAKADFGVIWTLGGSMLVMSIVQVSAMIGAAWFGARASMSFGRDLRQMIFDKVISFSRKEMGQFGAPSLITRNTNDVQQVQQFTLMMVIMIVSAPIMMVGGIIMALQSDPGLSWLIVVAVVLLGSIIGVLVIQMAPLFRQMQTRIDALNRVLREQITGLRVIRAFVREPTEAKRFDQANKDFVQVAISVGIRMMTLFPAVFFIMNLAQVAVMWFGAQRIAAGHLEVGQLTAYLSYLMQILMSVMMSTVMLMIGPRAAVTAARINEVLETEASVPPPMNPITTVTTHGDVIFDEVSFAYPGAEKPVLRDISFHAKSGTTTAIVGSTGAGKTTLVNLISRLFDVTGGQVLVDGVDIRDLDPDFLWSRIGLVPQRPYLFSGTVASNLRLGNPDATDDELWHALRIAQAADFVLAMDGQLAAHISQGGTNVSGGQRQRLAIARALVRQPEIYVFDDSFSALDVTTDATLRAALVDETGDSVVIVVAQRVSTILAADQIIVLDDGAVCGIGTHQELLQTNETYKEIVESQFRAEEVTA